jgi:hypothetical protein
MNEQKEKACNRCQSTTNGFYGDNKTKDKLRRYCKVCDNEAQKRTYLRNKEMKKHLKKGEEAFIKQLTKILGSGVRDVKEGYSPVGRRMLILALNNESEIKLYF